MPKITKPFFLLILLAGFLQNAFAHEKGENYIFLELKDDHIQGRFEFKYDDLQEKLGIDITEDGEMVSEKQEATAPEVQQYIRDNFAIGTSPDKLYDIQFTDVSLFHAEGGWAQYNFRLNTGPIPDELWVKHEMFYDNDRLHRGILVLEKGVWRTPSYEMHIAMVFAKSTSEQTLDVQNPPSMMTPKRMIWQGILHIWIGIDHILFLIALALPIVLVVRDQQWQPVDSFTASLWKLLKVVTVFTIAHSITLLLASLDIVSLPSRLVESVIAASIVLVAVNNIFGRSHNTSLVVILLLGLFHGLGFASVMSELPFRLSELKNLIFLIVGFNIGVELGQVVILAVTFPILFLLRKTPIYKPVILTGGSVVLILIAGYWFIERAFAL